MKKFIFSLLLSTTLCATGPAFSMDPDSDIDPSFVKQVKKNADLTNIPVEIFGVDCTNKLKIVSGSPLTGNEKFILEKVTVSPAKGASATMRPVKATYKDTNGQEMVLQCDNFNIQPLRLNLAKKNTKTYTSGEILFPNFKKAPVKVQGFVDSSSSEEAEVKKSTSSVETKAEVKKSKSKSSSSSSEELKKPRKISKGTVSPAFHVKEDVLGSIQWSFGAGGATLTPTLDGKKLVTNTAKSMQLTKNFTTEKAQKVQIPFNIDVTAGEITVSLHETGKLVPIQSISLRPGDHQQGALEFDATGSQNLTLVISNEVSGQASECTFKEFKILLED